MKCKSWMSFFLILFLSITCHAQSVDNENLKPTDRIGTADQPTIEGGIIHTFEVNRVEKKVTNDFLQEEVKQGETRHAFLADEFNDDENIKALLTQAANEGKLAYVLQRAEHLKLPATVALIPMVESGYQTDAISNKGATGAWQLMPKTAKAYSLKIEDRKNFRVSTDVALQVLSDLHQQWGNWTLAFAAYNAGSARLKKALCHCPCAKKIEALDLPLETSGYVRRLRLLHQALVKLSADSLKLKKIIIDKV